MWKVDLWKSEKEQSVHLYEANETPRVKRKSGKGVVEICMNIFDRKNREWFPTVSSHSRTGVYQKKLNGRTKKGREDAFSRILQFSCGTSCCSFLWLGKVYWVQKYLDKFTRVKYMKRFNKKNITFWLRRLVSHKFFGLEVPEGVRQNLDPWASDHTYPLMGAQCMWRVGISWRMNGETLATLKAFGRHQLVYKMSASAENEGQDWATGMNSSVALNQRHFKEAISSKQG